MSSKGRSREFQLHAEYNTLAKEGIKMFNIPDDKKMQLGYVRAVRTFSEYAVLFFHTYLVWAKENNHPVPYDFFQAFQAGVLDDEVEDSGVGTTDGSGTQKADAETLEREGLPSQEPEHESEEL